MEEDLSSAAEIYALGIENRVGSFDQTVQDARTELLK
jgi:hypothetical protein